MGRRFAFTVAVGLSLFGYAAAPAFASTDDALARCRDRVPSDSTANGVQIPGNGVAFVGGGPDQDAGTPLRDEIRPGDVIGVASRGSVSYGGFFGSAGTWGPDGNNNWAPGGSYPFPEGPQYALVGLWNQVVPGNSNREVILGSVSACLVVPPADDGVPVPPGLWLLPNDDDRSDNGGFYLANVHLWHA